MLSIIIILKKYRSWAVERKIVFLPAPGYCTLDQAGISRKKRKARKLLLLPEELSILCLEKTLGGRRGEGERKRGGKQAAHGRVQLRKAPWRARDFLTAERRPKPGEHEED